MSASFEWDVRASEREGVRKGRERERMGDRFRVAKGDNNFLCLLSTWGIVSVKFRVLPLL